MNDLVTLTFAVGDAPASTLPVTGAALDVLLMAAEVGLEGCELPAADDAWELLEVLQRLTGAER